MTVRNEGWGKHSEIFQPTVIITLMLHYSIIFYCNIVLISILACIGSEAEFVNLFNLISTIVYFLWNC